MNDGLVDLPALQLAFERGTGEYVAPNYHYFFSEIYVPILVRNEDHSPKLLEDGSGYEFEYVNVGLSAGDLTDAYWMLYRSNMLSEPLTNANAVNDAEALGKLIKCVLNLNKYKYLKWIDSMGYAYNPLWNVDGTELYQSLDNHGEVKTKRSPILQTNIMQSVTTDAQATLRPSESTSILYNNTTEEQVTGLADITQEEHEHAKNTVNGANVDYSVSAKDTAFGTALTGGDYMHVEKRLRQGNIGVTQTTELIRNERELVRINLIQEFFNDVNKQLLVGIYPGF